MTNPPPFDWVNDQQRRQRKRTRGGRRASAPPSAAAVPVVDLSPTEFAGFRVRAPRLILADLDGDERTRQSRVFNELRSLAEAGQAATIAVTGYLLANVTDGLRRGYGGTAAAVDEVTAALAAATALLDGDREPGGEQAP